MTYMIIRFYRDDRPSEVVRTGLTLVEAQAHCRRPDTRGEDWFDGYEREAAGVTEVKDEGHGMDADTIVRIRDL